jgi:alpha-galactosidase
MTSAARFADVLLEQVGPDSRVYESGWQSWSPSGVYPAAGTSPRAARPDWQAMGYRPETTAPPEGFQGEGLLAWEHEAGGTATVVSAADPTVEVPSIRARLIGDRLEVTADGPVVVHRMPGGIGVALRRWADDAGTRLQARVGASHEAGWCPWYSYFTELTAEAVLRNVAAMDELDLPIGLVSVDDGYQAAIGDWLTPAARFGPVEPVLKEILASGRRAGIWLAPFLVSLTSDVAAAHPDWLVRGADPGRNPNWGGQLAVLDTTHPGARRYLQDVVGHFSELGVTHWKLDFLFAGAMQGGRYGDSTPVGAYRDGLQLMREAAGDDATILGCGAPVLPSIGLVDTFRIGPDTDATVFEAPGGDLTQPAMSSAIRAGATRSFMHGRLWTNDPDCVLVGPAGAHREAWAQYLRTTPGVATSSDVLMHLDGRGLELSRELLRASDPRPA